MPRKGTDKKTEYKGFDILSMKISGTGREQARQMNEKNRIKDRFFMSATESLDTVRSSLQKAVEKKAPKEKSADGKSSTPSYVYVKEMAPGKAVVESGGKTYGVRWERDKGTGDVTVESMIPVEVQYREVGRDAT